MTRLMPDPRKGMTFHWTALDGTRYKTEECAIGASMQAREIARKVTDHLLGPVPNNDPAIIKDAVLGKVELTPEHEFHIQVHHEVRILALEVLLKDKSTLSTEPQP